MIQNSRTNLQSWSPGLENRRSTKIPAKIVEDAVASVAEPEEPKCDLLSSAPTLRSRYNVPFGRLFSISAHLYLIFENIENIEILRNFIMY